MYWVTPFVTQARGNSGRAFVESIVLVEARGEIGRRLDGRSPGGVQRLNSEPPGTCWVYLGGHVAGPESFDSREHQKTPEAHISIQLGVP